MPKVPMIGVIFFNEFKRQLSDKKTQGALTDGAAFSSRCDSFF